MKRISLFFATLVCLSLPLSAASRFAALVEGYQHPKAGPSGTVSNVSFSIGHIKLNLANGTASPVTVGGQQAALFFTGTGTFTYTSDDPVERPIVTHNVKVDSHLKLDTQGKNAVISGPVDEILLYAAGVPLPQVPAGSGAVSPDFAKHLEEFATDISTPGPVHGMVLQNLGAPAAKFVRAEIRSGRDLVVYLFDEPESTEEGLYTLHHPGADEPEIKHLLFARTLSDIPIGRDRKTPPPPPYVVTAIDYTLVADGDNAKLDVTETIVRNPQRQAVRFNQDDVRFAGRGGNDIRRFHVNAVTDEQGHALPFDHNRGDLIVGLESLSGDSVKLKFAIDGNFLVRPGGDAAWQLGITNWLPQPELNGQNYTLHSLIKVRKPFVAIAPGKTLRRAEDGDFNLVENEIDKPVSFAVVHAGKYELMEETRSGLTIRVASYAGRNERAAKKLANLAYQIIDYYQYFLGPFPFDEFNIIQVNTYGYGQAPPATMFITNEAFSMLDTLDQLFSQGINERFAHEIAHQDWGSTVKMPSIEEQWITEAFAEYSAALAIKKYQGEGKYNTLVSHWKARAKEYTDWAPIALANEVTGENAGRARTYLLYAKGPYLLYTLHKQMGEEPFLIFLKTYQSNRRWHFGSTADMASLLTYMTKKDQMPFFDKYYWGTAMPE